MEKIDRKDIFFHPDHGFVKVISLKYQDDDDQKPMTSIVCCKYGEKGKKSDEEIVLTKR